MSDRTHHHHAGHDDGQGAGTGPDAGHGLTADPSVVLQGYDTFSAAARSTAVQGTVNTVGARTTVSYYTCTSTEQLSTNLRISGELNASYLFAGVDAKSRYVQSLGVTSTSVVVAVYANVITGSQECTNAAFTQTVPLPTPAKLNDFYLQYGDSYVSTLTTGAEYIATYVLQAQSVTQQQEIVASLSASGVGESGAVSGSLETAVSQAASSNQVQVAFNQTLIGITGVPLPSQAELATFALAFDTRLPNAPEIISFETTGYEHVPGAPSGLFDPLRANRELFVGDGPGDGLVGAAEAVGQLGNQISQISDIYQAYAYVGDKLLAQRAAQTGVDREALKDVVGQLRQDATQKFVLPSLPSLAYGTPSVNFAVSVAPFIGVGGDESFQDVDYAGVLQRTRLVTLSLGEFTVPQLPVALIDAVRTGYQSADGPVVVVQHGEGIFSPVWQLLPDEYISSLDYYYTDEIGGVLAQLTVHTERGGVAAQALTWPPGLPDQLGNTQAGSFAVPPGSVALGFAGTLNTDQPVTALGVLGLALATFAPAVWTANAS